MQSSINSNSTAFEIERIKKDIVPARRLNTNQKQLFHNRICEQLHLADSNIVEWDPFKFFQEEETRSLYSVWRNFANIPFSGDGWIFCSWLQPETRRFYCGFSDSYSLLELLLGRKAEKKYPCKLLFHQKSSII